VKEVFKRVIFIILICVFWTSSVQAISEDCGNKEFWDPWDWTATVRSPGYGANPLEDLRDYTGSMPQNFVYNITNASMNGSDVLTIQGWAYTTGTRSTCTNSSVSFKLVPDGGGQEYESKPGSFNSVWTNETNFKYWTCARTGYQPGITAGRCRTGSESYMSGSFSHAIDLGQLKEEKTYTLMMKYNGPGSTGWFKVGIGEDVGGNLTSYKGNGSMNVSIDGFANKIEAVGYNRALGRSGTYCDAPGGSLSSKANNTLSGTYSLAGSAITAERQSGAMKLYPVSASGGTAYIPAITSRLVSDNGLKIKVTKGEDSEYDVVNPPAACEGGEVYIFHYFFIDELYGKTTDRHTGANANYGDIYAISEVLEVTSLSELIIGEGSYVTVRDGTDKFSLKWFHDNLTKASNAPHRYYQSGNEFFIDKESWIDYDHGGGVEEAPVFDIPYDTLKLKSVQAEVVINRMENSANNGFLFDIRRDYKSNTASGKKLISPWDKSAAGSVTHSLDVLYQPAIYTMSLCKKPKDVPAQCPDTVNPAVCSNGDTGTHVVFHENKDIKTCTLKAGTHSGFTIVDETDNNYSHKTTSPAGTVFGRVACKEDLDIYLPTSKQTASGQYFLLDNDAGYGNPHIKALRTCATTPVKYSDLDNDLKNNYEQPDQLEYLYNVYRDHLYVYNNFPSGPETEGPFDGTCIGSDKEVYDYTYTEWTIPNKGITIGDTPNGEYGYEEATGTYIPNIPDKCNLKSSKSPQEEWQDAYDAEEAKTWAAKSAYDTMLYNYHETVLAYNAMFNWEDKTQNTSYHSEGSIQNAAWINIKQGYVDTKYKFKPKVTFNYPDRDGSVFPVEYEYPVTQQSPSTKKSYWGEGSEPNNEYTNANGGYNVQPRQLTNCRDGGDTCVPLNITGSFHHNGALRRDETIEYDYNLPTVYTIVPSGVVQTNKPNRAHLTLDPEAVPVNINTHAGTYEYTISIHDLKDEIRKKYYNVKQNNPDDNWAESPPSSGETRFIQRKVLNAGQDYVCNYKVINDIYIPVNPERFNFFYRIIDTEDVNPNNRILGYNWTDGRGSKVQELMIRNEQSYQRLTNSPDVDKFVFTLTPVMMKQIRIYNAEQSYNDGYADWDLNCQDYGFAGGYHCYSNFLNCLTGGTGESGQKSCSQVLGDTYETALNTEFESKKSNYTLQDLQENRRVLINKQNNIDGRGVTTP